MLTLYYHPLASFCHKVLIALYEADIAFKGRIIDLGKAEERDELDALWPLGKFPVIRDEVRGRVVPESTIIIEYLCQHFPSAASLLGEDKDTTLDVRLWERVFDNYVHVHMQKIVADRLRAEGERDPRGVADARGVLQAAYAMLDKQLAHGTWAVGDSFTMADCAAAPSLFYAHILEPFPAGCPNLSSYFERLIARPSVARVLQEAKPWFPYFPFRELMPQRFL
jgi:glutathione S-transferase